MEKRGDRPGSAQRVEPDLQLYLNSIASRRSFCNFLSATARCCSDSLAVRLGAEFKVCPRIAKREQSHEVAVIKGRTKSTRATHTHTCACVHHISHHPKPLLNDCASALACEPPTPPTMLKNCIWSIRAGFEPPAAAAAAPAAPSAAETAPAKAAAAPILPQAPHKASVRLIESVILRVSMGQVAGIS